MVYDIPVEWTFESEKSFKNKKEIFKNRSDALLPKRIEGTLLREGP